MDIGGWLRSLGLEEYETAFRENKVDAAVLPKLTAEDLKDLGVAAVGDRRKLLEAVADLQLGPKPEPTPLAASSTVAAPAKDTAAERRQVTVMFSDLVGSTALSARMDPEDLGEVISAYQKCVAETVQRRARRAGVGHCGRCSEDLRAPANARWHIATGLVVVGDLIGSGASQEQAIVGETPNLAARLQGTAEPNSVVIAESTRKLVGNLFELEDLGAQDLKGISVPVRAWAALRPSSVESHFEAMHASGLTELVGREEEIEILLRRWSKMAQTRSPGQGVSAVKVIRSSLCACCTPAILRFSRTISGKDFLAPYPGPSSLRPSISSSFSSTPSTR